MSNIIQLTESELIRFIRTIISESDNNKAVEYMNILKNEISGFIDFYDVDENGDIIDAKTKEKVPSVKKVGSFYKTKIESVLFGAENIDKVDNLSIIYDLKDAILDMKDGKFIKLFGEYDSIPVTTNQKNDYYTGLKCISMDPKSPGCKS
jgi:hypothetical protein